MRTRVLLAWIFSLLFLVVWVIGFIYNFIISFVLGMFGLVHFSGLFLALGLIYGVIFLMLLIPSVWVFRKVSRMKKAADSGDVAIFRRLNTTNLGVIALIFDGVVPGVLLFMMHVSTTHPAETRGQVKAPITDSTSEVLEKIVKLKGLMDSGALTRKEFDQQKDLLLHPTDSAHSLDRDLKVESELQSAKSLYDSGILTADEYDGLKKRLLAEM